MRIATRFIVLTLLASALSAVALPAPALAVVPDYILLDRCLATMDERVPARNRTWQLGYAFVAIEDAATGLGGWLERHTFQYTAYAYVNGPNGYAEYGTGDDICLGRADALPGILTYDVPSSLPDAASGMLSLADSPSGNYSGNRNISATINQSFDFSGLTEISLLFFHHHDMRWTSGSDRCYVEVNTGNGWVSVDPVGTPAFSYYAYHLGDNHQFKRGGADLSAFAGEPNVQIRLRFTSNTSSHDDGWFVDDVRVLGDGNTLFFDDFELGAGQWTLDAPWGLSLAGYTYETGLGTIDNTGLYHVTPVTAPVSIGEGMGWNGVHAAYTENNVTRHAYAKVHHTGPQWVAAPVPPGSNEGYDDICPATVAVDETTAPIHNRLVLAQNSPNPFNPTTGISFKLSAEERATLRIYDESGRLVRSLLAGALMPAGEHTLTWDGRDGRGELLSSGVYLYRLTVGSHTLARKMVMIR